MRTAHLLGILGALALTGAGCGNETTCGEGTVDQNGTCVPTGDICGEGSTFDEETGECVGNACADGTVLVDGECVPDGSVVCGDGTSYDPDTGECVPDTTCGEGTVLVDGECVPYDDSVTADVEELPEPNGFPDDNAGQFTLPGTGGDVTITGCIDPYEDGDANACFATNLDPDFDAYYFIADGPTLLNITVDGLNGLSGGFVVFGADDELFADGWARFGINPVDDIATRQVFLPKEGVYAIGITDGRSLLLSEAFGGPDDCYLATVEVLPLPSATAITGATATGNLGDVQFYSYGAVAEGDLLFTELAAPSSAAVGAVVTAVEGAYRNSGETGIDGNGDPVPAEVLVGGLSAGDGVVYVVDHVYNYSLAPVPYTLRIDDVAAQALPSDGSAVTLTWDADRPSYVYFDATAVGEMWRHQLTSDDGEFLFINLLDGVEGTYLGAYCDAWPCDATDEWARYPHAGRYYLEIVNVMESPLETYALSATTSHYTPAPMTVGTAVTGQTVNEDNANWYTVNVAAVDWLRVTANDDNTEGEVYIEVHDGNSFGVLGQGIGQYDSFSLATGGDIGRVLRAMGVDRVLIAAGDTNGTTGGTFDLTFGERTYTTATAAFGTPYQADDVALGAGEIHYYMVETPERDSFMSGTIARNASEYFGIETLLVDEDYEQIDVIDEGGEPAQVFDMAGREGFVAVAVWEDTGTAGTYDLGFYAYEGFYTATAGSDAFADICECGGNQVELLEADEYPAEDEGLTEAIALDQPFYLFGAEATEMVVSSNGWVTFEPGYEGSSWAPGSLNDGEESPNFQAAPFGADLDHVTVCVRQDSDRVIIQWTGEEYVGGPPGSGAPVRFQAVLHDDGFVDFIYGDGHELDSSAAVIGLESQSGDWSRTISDYQSGFTNPGTSIQLEPNPIE